LCWASGTFATGSYQRYYNDARTHLSLKRMHQRRVLFRPLAASWPTRISEVCTINSNRRSNRCRVLIAWLPQPITAAPNRLDVVLAPRGIGQFLAQLADEHVDDLLLRFIHTAV